MLVVTIVMLVILVLCGLLAMFVAFPHRGEPVPAAPWLGEVMARAVDAMPTIEPEGDPSPRGAPAPNRPSGPLWLD